MALGKTTSRPLPSAARTVASAQAVDPSLVNTATLIRGRVYVYRHKGEPLHFEIGVPQVVDDELAGALEELHSEVHDSDGDAFEKPLFSVERKVNKPVQQIEPRHTRNITRLPARPIPPRPAR